MGDAFLVVSAVLIALCSVPLLAIYALNRIPSRKIPE